MEYELRSKRQVDISQLVELERFAVDCAREWRQEAAGRRYAQLVSLEGELGAGKTAFVKALARALGCAAEPVSPTFVLHQAYPFPVKGELSAGTLHHWDVYRLKDPVRELPRLGFGDILKENNAIVCVEWGDRIRELFTVPHSKLQFRVLPDRSRTIAISKVKAQKAKQQRKT